MREVMRNGRLEPAIRLDTIRKSRLNGIGPEAFLRGELMVIDGQSYRATVGVDSMVKVEESWAAGAPFFVYAHVETWDNLSLPESVSNLESLEIYLDSIFASSAQPRVFKLSGVINAAKIHILNLPAGTIVRSPVDAHRGKRILWLRERTVDMIGFYSSAHQGVFTHHGSHVHLHLITEDKLVMGHVDSISFASRKMKLYAGVN